MSNGSTPQGRLPGMDYSEKAEQKEGEEQVVQKLVEKPEVVEKMERAYRNYNKDSKAQSPDSGSKPHGGYSPP